MSTEPRPSVWQRIKRWFVGDPVSPTPVLPPPPPPPPVEVKYRPPEQNTSAAALAKGEVYEFRVFADVEWSTNAMSYHELVRQAGLRAATVTDDVRRRVWDEARRHAPHEAAEAEREIRKKLGSWCYETDHGTIRCEPTVRVLPDVRVQKHLTPYVLRSISEDREAALGHERAALLEKLVARWREVLLELRVSPVTLSAAQLSDQSLANVLGGLANHRRGSTLELVQVLEQATKDHEQLGMFEFAEMYATAIAAFRRQMEIEDSRFVDQMMEPPREEPAQ
jgi:hypothetical protein